MGKLNEIQEEVKQSYGSNSFTTTIKEETVEFDSAKDSFTFKDDAKFEGKLLKKRADREVYDEIKSVDFSSSYTSGQQIATAMIDGKSKPIYVRESIFLDGIFSPNRQLWFKMDEENGELFVSFDKGANWKKILLEN